jgi:carbamoyl-phosphate synthase small subunit
MVGVNAKLVLEDGSIFTGYALGALDKQVTYGEVVFNTSMYGYQEIMTDPSYAGQIVTFTTPHIGNIGCNEEDYESVSIFARGIIIRDYTKIVSNFRARFSLDQWLKNNGILGIYGIDTRRLVTHLRNGGSQSGAIGLASISNEELLTRAIGEGNMLGKDFVPYVTTPTPYSWTKLPWNIRNSQKFLKEEQLFNRPHVVAIDCGIKRSIMSLLVQAGFRVTVVPATMLASEINRLSPDCLFISNGPGDPSSVTYVIDTLKELMGKIPVFGICLGHQLMAHAIGGKTYKLKFGHRGGNHPVKDLLTDKVEVTVQNHGFAVDKDSLPSDAVLTHINLNDGTVEGIAIPELKSFGVQYHPESSPGPHDSQYLFRRFYEWVVDPTLRTAKVISKR